jgi:hypothetical protein
MDSQPSLTHAFIEPIIYDKEKHEPLQTDQTIYNIDIKKCRKNILLEMVMEYHTQPILLGQYV